MSKYIAFEGIDGAGKTTQVELLIKHLVSLGLRAEKLVEPTPWVGMTRLNIRGIELTPEMELMLHLLDRAINIRTRLEANGSDFLISDRFYLSSMVYNSSKHLSMRDIFDMHSFMPQPDMIFWIDRSPKSAWKLIQERGEKLSKFEDSDQIKTYADRYEKAVRLFPQTVQIKVDKYDAEQLHTVGIWPQMVDLVDEALDRK